uniref:WD_REPEATS_REGION domain-containing protein n=1 Tax=Syphacia muris TaxID=451379 RepID=A0A0N5AHU8_9BILA
MYDGSSIASDKLYVCCSRDCPIEYVAEVRVLLWLQSGQMTLFSKEFVAFETLERTVAGETASVGIIGTQTKKIYTGPPLVQYCYDDDAAEECDHELLTTLPSSSINCIALGNDEKSLAYSTTSIIKSVYVWASASSDCTAAIWDTRQHPANVQVRRLDRSANCVQFSPNDAFIAVGSDNLYMIDLRVRAMRTLSSTSQVTHVRFHPSEYLLATASDDRLVRFWDIDSEECVSQSDSSDGPIRSIAFHPEGCALFTLTDRRCGAISWEPFDVLGQQSVMNCDRALCLALDDQSAYVLSRSLTLKHFCVQTASFSVMEFKKYFYTQNFFILDFNSDNQNNQEAIKSNNFENEDSEIQIFMPSRTLQRTPPPPPFAIPPCEEKFVASAVVDKPSSRPVTLKTKRLPNSAAKSSIKHHPLNGRTSLSGNRPSKLQHPTSRHLPTVSSVPDARTAAPQHRKRIEKENKILHAKNESTDITDGDNAACVSEDSLLEEIVQGHSNVMIALEHRKTSFDILRQCWRSKGIENALSEAAKIGDPSLLVEFLSLINHSPSLWNLSLCCVILAHLDSLVSSKNEGYVEVALAALRTAISSFGTIIRENAQNVSHIGVDITAEERHEKCVKCVKQLTGMRVKAALITNQMNSRHAREFNVLMQIFDDTISPL